MADFKAKSRWNSYRLVAIMLFIALAIGAVALFVLNRIETATRVELERSLQSTLNMTHSALEEWRNTQLKLISYEVKDRNELSTLVERLLVAYRNGEELPGNINLKLIRELLQPIIRTFNYQGFFVIAPDMTSIASLRDSNLGVRNLLADEGAFLEQIFHGSEQFSHSIESDVPLPDKDGHLLERQPTMFIAVPISDAQGVNIAALAFRIAPNQDFSRIARRGRFVQTGETYFFDQHAHLMSFSRYEAQLHEIGLLKKGESSLLNLKINDPGGDLTRGYHSTLPIDVWPLTLMAKEALAGRSGMNLDGYRDYRGVMVVGAWITPYVNENVGIVTEIDKAEAYEVFNITRQLLLAGLLVTTLLLLLLTAIIASGRRRAISYANEVTEELRRSEQHFQYLAHLSDLLLRTTSVDSMLDVATQEVRRIFAVKLVWLLPPCQGEGGICYAPIEVVSNGCRPDITTKMANKRGAPTLASRVISVQDDDSIIECGYLDCMQNEITVALRPTVGEPWLLGLCLCDGRQRWSDAEEQLLHEIAGRITTALTNFMLMEKLEESLKERQSIMDTVPDIILTTDVEGRLVSWNSKFEQLIGLPISEIKGFLLRTLVYEDDLELFDEATVRCLQEGYVETEVRVIYADGHIAPFRFAAATRVDADGNVVSISGSGCDITELKEVESALQKNRERLTEAQRIACVGNWSWNIEKNSLEWSEQIYRIFGLDIKSTDLTYKLFLSWVHLDDCGKVKQTVDEALKNRSPYSIDYRILLPDGSIRIVHEQGEINFSEKAFPVGIFGTIQDITESKLAAEELRKHRDNLQGLVDEQTAYLKKAISVAENANHAKSEFLANMSHELRTPMHAILSFAALGERKIEGATRERLLSYFSRISVSGERLMLLLNDLLDLSKMEAGHVEFDLQLHDLREVVELAVNDFSALLNEHSQTIKIVSTKLDTNVWFDKPRMLQVLSNLLSNAIKFTPDGRSIEISFAQDELSVGRRDDDIKVPAIAVSVADQGIGVPEDELDAVFNQFIQSSKTNTGAGGTGLGLAISKDIIVGGHHGTLKADNHANGAVFTFVIPCKVVQNRPS
ncbi:MAG: PAS domain S-box protein [Candidatus Polarisedimenticolaceae bacterium]|nr:PAS domain S-box protein [Candidatus Polarisedimenticolaceae bacterium]